jgi:hypothetical protein
MDAIEILVFVLVFGGILAAYEFGRRNGEASARKSQMRWSGGNRTAAEVLLEYRNATGFTTLRKALVLGYMPRGRGRSCLFALCNNGTAPRTFRIDRIISIATLDGEVLDMQKFLEQQLGVKVAA